MILAIRPVRLASRVALAGSILAYTAGTSFAQCPVETFKWLASDGAPGDRFGVCVAISGTTAIVGAYRDEDNGLQSGSAYLFDTSTGLQLAKLLPSDAASSYGFGYSVAISGTTAIIGALADDDNGLQSGSAYLFDTSTGLQLAKLLPIDGAPGDQFGYSVAISGTTAIVGAINDDDNGSNSGSAYLFDAVTGLQLAKLLPIDGGTGNRFGYSVAISGATAIVGAFWDNDNGPNSGSAYLFDTSTGLETTKLLPSDGAPSDTFGFSVAISGNTAVVGANVDSDNGSSSGSAYLFDITTGLQLAKLLPSDGAAEERFGTSVAISAATAIVGAYEDDDNGIWSGSAYAFVSSDCNGNGTSDYLDIAFATSLDCDLDSVPDECQIVANAALDVDGNGLLDSCESNGYAFLCNGDGGDQMGCTNCPCANNALPGTFGGCLNSSMRSARLAAQGDSSVSLPAGSSGDLRFSLTGVPPTSFCVLKSGDGVAPGNAANPCFGLSSGIQFTSFDGLRCSIANERRHGGRPADQCGEVGENTNPWGGEGGPPAGIAVAGAGFVSGQTRYFQVVYRDDPLQSCMRGLNSSQAVEVVFSP